MPFLRGLPDESVDVTITSPPYCMGRPYEKGATLEDFIELHELVLAEVARVTKRGGAICWQVGYHVTKDRVVTPLDYEVHRIALTLRDLVLRNRIIWHFGHGLHSKHRFSGRHETILWYSRGDGYHFDLDAVRVPHKYPGKKASKGERRGQPSGNPLGKNPEDVWVLPNVRANHVEKTAHPCQFPVALAQRLIRALCPIGGRVMDPFAGAGSTAAAAILEGRGFIGAEVNVEYCELAEKRVRLAKSGKLRVRPLDAPIFAPHAGLAVARKPSSFRY